MPLDDIIYHYAHSQYKSVKSHRKLKAIKAKKYKETDTPNMATE